MIPDCTGPSVFYYPDKFFYFEQNSQSQNSFDLCQAIKIGNSWSKSILKASVIQANFNNFDTTRIMGTMHNGTKIFYFRHDRKIFKINFGNANQIVALLNPPSTPIISVPSDRFGSTGVIAVCGNIRPNIRKLFYITVSGNFTEICKGLLTNLPSDRFFKPCTLPGNRVVVLDGGEPVLISRNNAGWHMRRLGKSPNGSDAHYVGGALNASTFFCTVGQEIYRIEIPSTGPALWYHLPRPANAIGDFTSHPEAFSSNKIMILISGMPFEFYEYTPGNWQCSPNHHPTGVSGSYNSELSGHVSDERLIAKIDDSFFEVKYKNGNWSWIQI